MRIAGNVFEISNQYLIVRADGSKLPALESVIYSSDNVRLGKVVDYAGPVKKPWIIVLFSPEANIDQLQKGTTVFSKKKHSPSSRRSGKSQRRNTKSKRGSR